jgi:hypothetical protein
VTSAFICRRLKRSSQWKQRGSKGNLFEHYSSAVSGLVRGSIPPNAYLGVMIEGVGREFVSAVCFLANRQSEADHPLP